MKPIWMPVRDVFDWNGKQQHWFLEIIEEDGEPACRGIAFTRNIWNPEEREELRQAAESEPAAEDWHVLVLLEGDTWTGIVPLVDGHPIIRYPGRGAVEWAAQSGELNPHDVEVWDIRKITPGIAGNNIVRRYGWMAQTGEPEFLGYGSGRC